jgi:hypothetical protein
MYGVKRGIKAPGEFGIGDMTGLALAGATGIIAALIADYQQKGEAAALFKINEWVVQFGSILGLTAIPLWMVVVGITAVGAGSVFYFQPITRQGAFAQGFGLLAVLLTMTPPNLASGIQGINETLPGLTPASLTREASLKAHATKASYTPGNARVIQAQNRNEAARYDVRLEVTFPEGLDDDVASMIRRNTLRGRLHNQDTGATYNLFLVTDGGGVKRQGDTLIFHVGVPAQSERAQLWIRVEAMGYAIEEQSAEAVFGQPLQWNVEMTPSNTPLYIQRLGMSFWF